MAEELVLQSAGPRPSNSMSFGLWLATEGGRKCPQCGRYAKPAELGYVGGRFGDAIVTAYGHRRGYGCNRRKRVTPC